MSRSLTNEAPVAVNFSDMTKSQLLDYAEDYGISGVNDRMTKAEIVARLEEE